MEGSNYWGYDYKTQHSYPRSRLITWRRPEVKFGRNVVKKKQHKNYQDEDKKSAINKKLILTFLHALSSWGNAYAQVFQEFLGSIHLPLCLSWGQFVWYNLIALSWLWRWWATLDCEIPSSPNSLTAAHWICLYGMEHGCGCCQGSF